MGSAVKAIHGVQVVSEKEDLVSTLRWWMKLCFGIGLPLSQPSYSFRVKLFILALVLGDLIVGVTSVIRLVIYDYVINLSTTANQISSIILNLNLFVLATVFHAVVVWNLKDLNTVIQTLNHHISVDLKLRKFLQIAVVLAIFFVAITQTASVILTAYAAYQSQDSFKFWYAALWTLWVAFEIYAEVMSYTISLLIAALGYQFSLLRQAIEIRTFISWEKLYERHIQLCTLSAELQKCFDSVLVLLMGSIMASICISAFYIAEEITANNISFDFILMVLTVLKHGLWCVCLCAASDYLREKANSLALCLADAAMKYPETPHATKFIKALCNNVRNLQHLTSFSVGGFCRLGKPLLLTILAVAMSYFILLRQIKDTGSGCSTNYTKICENLSLTTPKP